MNTILELLINYGYWILFLALLLENTLFVGLVVPGETVLLAASFLASRNYFDIFLVVVFASLAAIVGNILGYSLGRVGGRPLIERFGHRLFHSDRKILEAESYFDSHGGKTVFIGRFTAGVRVFVAALAGVSKMNFLKFLFFTFTSTVLWTLGLSLIGYFFGTNWDLILKVMEGFGWGILLLIIIFILGFYLYRSRRKKYSVDR